MIEIVHPCFGFIGDLPDDIAVRQMAFNACELLVAGLLPLNADVFHAVTGYAEGRASGCMIPPHGEHSEQDADESSCNENL